MSVETIDAIRKVKGTRLVQAGIANLASWPPAALARRLRSKWQELHCSTSKSFLLLDQEFCNHFEDTTLVNRPPSIGIQRIFGTDLHAVFNAGGACRIENLAAVSCITCGRRGVRQLN